MEHKSFRTFLIFFFGSLGGSFYHGIFSCHPLCGASGGIYALIGACIIKIKHHLRYKGILRRACNLGIVICMLSLVIGDVTITAIHWSKCRTNVALWAHLGGLLVGITLGYLILDKYQESWAIQYAEINNDGERNDIKELKREIKCCNCNNFETGECHNCESTKNHRVTTKLNGMPLENH